MFIICTLNYQDQQLKTMVFVYQNFSPSNIKNVSTINLRKDKKLTGKYKFRATGDNAYRWTSSVYFHFLSNFLRASLWDQECIKQGTKLK